jgi:hypothetical protein
MDLYKYLVDTYGYNEPIFMDELNNELFNLKPETLRQSMKRLADNKKIYRYEYRDGIYFIPDPDSLLKAKALSVNKIIQKRYLYKRNKRIGYISGLSFANSLRLTTQNPATIEIVTEAESAAKRTVKFNKRKVTLRKPRVQVNDENYRVLQVLDLLTNFEKVSTEPMKVAVKDITDYLKDVPLTTEQLNQYLKAYPGKTFKRILESELYDALTQR